jgi:formate dehydrogenase maturation protein FdhE
MIVESLLSSLEEFNGRLADPANPPCAINYCPFCSSSFVRVDNIESSGHRYHCGDCDMAWTMVDPVV